MAAIAFIVWPIAFIEIQNRYLQSPRKKKLHCVYQTWIYTYEWWWLFGTTLYQTKRIYTNLSCSASTRLYWKKPWDIGERRNVLYWLGFFISGILQKLNWSNVVFSRPKTEETGRLYVILLTDQPLLTKVVPLLAVAWMISWKFLEWEQFEQFKIPRITTEIQVWKS